MYLVSPKWGWALSLGCRKGKTYWDNMRKDPYDCHLWLPPQEPKYKSTSGFVQSWFVATSIKSCAVWVWGGGVLKFKIAVLLVLLLELMVRESSKKCSLGQQLVCGGPLCTVGSKRVVNACFSLTQISPSSSSSFSGREAVPIAGQEVFWLAAWGLCEADRNAGAPHSPRRVWREHCLSLYDHLHHRFGVSLSSFYTFFFFFILLLTFFKLAVFSLMFRLKGEMCSWVGFIFFPFFLALLAASLLTTTGTLSCFLSELVCCQQL